MPAPIQIALVLNRAPHPRRHRPSLPPLGIDVIAVGDAVVSGTLSPSLCQLLFRVTAAGHQADIAEPQYAAEQRPLLLFAIGGNPA